MIPTIITSAIVMLLLDYIYLSACGNFFNKIIKNIQGSKLELNIYGAIICYIFLIFGLNYFVLLNKKLDYKKKLINSVLLGLVIYGVYESVNLAILKNWTWEALILDTVWGGLLFVLTTIFTIFILKKLNIK